MPRLSRRLFLLGFASVAVVLCGYSKLALAMPLETFSSPLSITCGEGQRECSGVLRVADNLGGHTGISIIKGLAGEVSLKVGRPAGKLKIEAQDATDVAIAFSWDGDSNPDLLSGAGLNCFDLTQQGAYAFIVSRFSANSECSSDALVSECPNFSIDSRVYDSQDPTGQHFSASTIVRGEPVKDADLAVPFSNFVRFGTRGKGRFTCAGAVTMTFRWRGLEDLEVEFGPIFTNGREGLKPLPTPSIALTATPLNVTPEPVTPEHATATVAPSASVTEVPAALDTIASSPLPVAPEQKTSLPTIKKPPPITSEVIYGSVVVGQ